jgi:peptidyl-prolyl cis-trans isomerase SurA
MAVLRRGRRAPGARVLVRVPRAVVPVLVAAAVAGCSIPSWVPLVGKSGGGKSSPSTAAAPAPAATARPAPDGARLPDTQSVMDRVICVVNNDAITLYELDEAEVHYMYETKQDGISEEARGQLRDRLLQSLIENRIQLQQAEREKIVVDDNEIKDQLAEVMKKVKASNPQEFDDMLKQQGLTLEAVKKRIREQLLVQRLTRRKVALRISVTEQEIDTYLTANRDKLEAGLTFHARHILFLPGTGSEEEGWQSARRKAERVYALVREGQDFAALAREHSEDPSGKDGGDLGTLKRGELTPEIEQAILRLDAGQTSAPVRSPVGYHLFHLDSKETLSGDAMTQTRSQIRDILYREKYESRMRDWLAEIKQRAIIDVRL